MAWWFFHVIGSAGSDISAATNENFKAGTAIGATIATGVILWVWVAGAVILGLLVLFTPGKTIITETTKD